MKEKGSLLRRLGRVNVGAPSSMLVFETDGGTLYGALAHTGVTNLEFEAVAYSRALELPAAVGEVLVGLRGMVKKRLPRKAVLVTPSAVNALLELPVNPQQPRPPAQMREMMRWELENLFSGQNDIWSIGALLMLRGYLDPVRRREIVAEMERRAGKHPGRATVRFGEVALDLGHVSREQIDECLGLQERLALFDDELVCGWTPQLRDEEVDEEAQYPWLAAGVGEAMRKQWAAAFRRHGVSLQWIYPQLGPAFSLLGGSGDREGLLVEVRQEQIALFRGRPGALVSMRVESCEEGSIVPERLAGYCHDQMRPDIDAVYLSAAGLEVAELADGLRQRLQREVITLPLPKKIHEMAGKVPHTVLASLAGVVLHASGRADAAAVPRVEAQPPHPPLWKRRELWPYAAAASLLLGVAGFEAQVRFQVWENQQELARLDAEYEQKLRMKKQTEASASQAARLQDRLVEQRERLEQLRRDVRKLERIVQRRSHVVALLDVISGAMGDGILLDQIEEGENGGGFRLAGWSLTHTTAELFMTRLSEAVGGLGLRLSDRHIRKGQNRLGADGYLIELQLEPQPRHEGQGA